MVMQIKHLLLLLLQRRSSPRFLYLCERHISLYQIVRQNTNWKGEFISIRTGLKPSLLRRSLPNCIELGLMLQSTKIGMATRNGKSLTRCCYYSLACHSLDFSVIVHSLYHPIRVIAFSLIVLDFLYILDTPTTSDYTNYTTPNIKGLSTQTPIPYSASTVVPVY